MLTTEKGAKKEVGKMLFLECLSLWSRNYGEDIKKRKCEETRSSGNVAKEEGKRCKMRR